MLNNFSSYFEIFGALNLAYAGSEGFRNAIDDEILKLRDAITFNAQSKIKETKSKITVLKAEAYVPALEQKAISIENNYTLKSDNLIKREKDLQKFTEGFKSMFLASSLFSISLILIGGFEQYLPENSKDINLFLIFLLPIFLFNLFVFSKSFTNQYEKKIRPTITISYVLILFIITFSTLYYCPFHYTIEEMFPEQLCISLALIVAISPYLLHFLRVFIHKQYFRFQFSQLEKKTIKELQEINNWIDFIHK